MLVSFSWNVLFLHRCYWLTAALFPLPTQAAPRPRWFRPHSPPLPGLTQAGGVPGLAGLAASLPGGLRKALQSSVCPSLKWRHPHPPPHNITEQDETHVGEPGAQPHGGRLPRTVIPGAPWGLLLGPGAPSLRDQKGRSWGPTGVECRAGPGPPLSTHVFTHVYVAYTHVHMHTSSPRLWRSRALCLWTSFPKEALLMLHMHRPAGRRGCLEEVGMGVWGQYP